jgi:Methionine synthase I (cobalamin-dependent), methyltransferase domain
MLHDIFKRYPKKFPLPLLLDGATGTQLMKRGMPNGYCTETFVLENPDLFINMQKEYVNNGADIVLAPTFGANRPSILRHGYDESVDVAELNKSLVAISKQTGAKFIGGDMSPTGLFIEPFGDSTFDEIVEIYAEQARGLEAGGVDFFMCETNINLNEVRAEVIGIRQVSDKPIFVTITVDENGRTISGDTLLAALITLADLGINAFGANCSTGPDKMYDQLKLIVPYAVGLGIPLIAKPNAGMPHQHEDGSQTFDMDPCVFKEYADIFLSNGIYIFGGCCGTDENFIGEMRKRIDDTKIFELPEAAEVDNLVCTNKEICLRDEAESVEITDMDEAEEFIEDSAFGGNPVNIIAGDEILKYIKKYYNGKV